MCEQQRLGYFSGRSAVCCKCIHATIKAYLNTYYENNGDKVKTNEKASCRSERVARPAPPLPQRYYRPTGFVLRSFWPPLYDKKNTKE